MDAKNSNPFDDMQVCNNCGAWVRSQRPSCPWCGTQTVQLEQDDTTATADFTSVEYEASSPEAAPPYGHEDELSDFQAAYRYEPSSSYGAAAETRIVDHYDFESDPVESDPVAGDGDGGSSRSAFGYHFWYRSFGLSITFVIVLLFGFACAGVYQGLEDRESQDKKEAIDHFVEGRALLEEKRYDLAIAYFREALRLQPNFEAASQLMAQAEEKANLASEEDQEVEASPGNEPDNERLFTEAMNAMEREDWEMAAETLDLLNSRAAGFRPEEVTEHLFTARMNAGKAALNDGSPDKALRHFDQALSVRPDDREAQRYRRLTSAYRAGVRAIEEEKWRTAADQFRAAYLLDPDFLDVSERLFGAHVETAKMLEERSIWCEAAQEYNLSLAVLENSKVAKQAQVAEERCENRRAAPTEVPVVQNPDRQETGGAIDPAPTPTTSITATVPLPDLPFQVAGNIAQNAGNGCSGHYITGWVRGAGGAPLAGVHILAIDEYGNQYRAVSKQDPLGAYDIPVNKEVPLTYQVRIVSGEEAISPILSLQYDESFTQSPQACYIVNWQRVK